MKIWMFVFIGSLIVSGVGSDAASAEILTIENPAYFDLSLDAPDIFGFQDIFYNFEIRIEPDITGYFLLSVYHPFRRIPPEVTLSSDIINGNVNITDDKVEVSGILKNELSASTTQIEFRYRSTFNQYLKSLQLMNPWLGDAPDLPIRYQPPAYPIHAELFVENLQGALEKVEADESSFYLSDIQYEDTLVLTDLGNLPCAENLQLTLVQLNGLDLPPFIPLTFELDEQANYSGIWRIPFATFLNENFEYYTPIEGVFALTCNDEVYAFSRPARIERDGFFIQFRQDTAVESWNLYDPDPGDG
jgi:hypothetical protein